MRQRAGVQQPLPAEVDPGRIAQLLAKLRGLTMPGRVAQPHAVQSDSPPRREALQ